MRRKKKDIRGRVDPDAFMNLKTETMNIKQNHKTLLGDYFIKKGYEIKNGNDIKSFSQLGAILKEIARNINKLKQSYGN